MARAVAEQQSDLSPGKSAVLKAPGLPASPVQAEAGMFAADAVVMVASW